MKQRILSISLALVALGAAIFGANYWRANYLAGVSMVKLPVPVADIPPYTLLTADMFEMREYPRALVDAASGSGYALSTGDLASRISASVLVAGQPVSMRLASPPAEFRLADPSLEVVSIPLDPISGVGGQVRIGEQVNLYRLQKPPEQDQAEAGPTPEAQVIYVATVPVVAVLGGDGQAAIQPFTAVPSQDQGGQPPAMKMLVVAAPPETVQAILEAIAMSKLEGELLWVTLATP